MSQQIWTRAASAKVPAGQPTEAAPIYNPPEDADAVKAECDSFIFDSFTVDDAWVLGNLLRQRLLPLASQTPTVISIALANNSHVLFQCVNGSGMPPDNEVWVRRKRNSVLRWGCSTWFMHCKFNADEEAFAAKYGLSPEKARDYAIHGGGVPIRVKGVEGVVAVVVVSGLKQHQDHGVIVDVIRSNWQPLGS